MPIYTPDSFSGIIPMVITKTLSPMNKYLVKLPYQYPQYGTLYGFVYAEDEEEAEDLAQDRCNLHDEDYNDKDSGDSEYFYDELEVELEESDLSSADIPARPAVNGFKSEPSVPEHFLQDLIQLATL